LSEIILKHRDLQATILPVRGALISSLKLGNYEILKLTEEFNLSGSGWPAGGIPFLFPVAGRSFSKGIAGRYDAFDKDWPMPIHGFSYGMPWAVKAYSDHSVVLVLDSSETSLSLYPWKFNIEYHVSIENQALELKTVITNLGCVESSDFPMPVAPGFHPYFSTSSDNSVYGQNLSLKFKPKNFLRVNAAGKVDKQADFPIEDTYSLDQPHFSNGIFMVDSPARFQLESAKWKIQVESKSSRYLVFWTKDRNIFQCIEPWFGVPDALGFSALNQLEGKPHPYAANLIPKGKTFIFDMKIKFS
jgi:galactose mutarotase-like enzyme